MKDYLKRTMTEAEEKYTFRQSSQISEQTGLIGHFRADFGTSGTDFYSYWEDWNQERKTSAFKQEMYDIIDYLRKDGDILSGRAAMSKYCRKTPQSQMAMEPRCYGVRVDTEQYAYLLRLNPNKGDYNLYCYCYERKWLDRHMEQAETGIPFSNQEYKEEKEMAEPITKNPEEEKHMIWSNLDLDLDDWRDDLLEEDPGLTEDELYQRMIELNDDHLDDERCNLNIETGTQIIALGDLGLWHGRVSGYKVIESGNIKDCLTFYKDIEYAEWYVDGNGEFKGTGIHHDGVNYYTYRAVREDASEKDVDDLLDKVYKGCATQEDIQRVTRRLGDDIGKVYGWDFPPEQIPTKSRKGSIQDYQAAHQGKQLSQQAER